MPTLYDYNRVFDGASRIINNKIQSKTERKISKAADEITACFPVGTHVADTLWSRTLPYTEAIAAGIMEDLHGVK
jgi:hypothetical protein